MRPGLRSPLSPRLLISSIAASTTCYAIEVIRANFEFQGSNHPIDISLFDEIAKIIEFHKPKYIILENVPHLKKHDNEETWNYIVSVLQNKLEYEISHRIYSPQEFGIPQHRNRVFITGAAYGLDHFSWPEPLFYPLELRAAT